MNHRLLVLEGRGDISPWGYLAFRAAAKAKLAMLGRRHRITCTHTHTHTHVWLSAHDNVYVEDITRCSLQMCQNVDVTCVYFTHAIHGQQVENTGISALHKLKKTALTLKFVCKTKDLFFVYWVKSLSLSVDKILLTNRRNKKNSFTIISTHKMFVTFTFRHRNSYLKYTWIHV